MWDYLRVHTLRWATLAACEECRHHLGTPDNECWASRYRQRGSHSVVRSLNVVVLSLGMRSYRRKVAASGWPTLSPFVLGQRNARSSAH